VGALVALVLLIAGCGTTQPSAGDTGDAPSTEGSSGPITITDQAGRTVELPGPAKRVVILEWQQVEAAVLLGVTPVGVADVKGYNTWVTAAPVDPGTTDVGTRGEPNMDAVFSADPDLVIVESERGSPMLTQLEKYDVPVLVTRGADAKDPIANMKATFNLIAVALGREDQAAKEIEEFDRALEAGREKVSGADGRRFIFADAWLDGSNLSIRPFGQGSLVGEIGEALGLENAWTGKVDAAYGLGQTDVEGMANVRNASFFHTSTDSDTWLHALDGNALWKGSDFVTENSVHPFPPGIWTFGGPASSRQLIDAFVEAVS